MCPKIPRGRHRGGLESRHTVPFRNQAGAEYWISRDQAAKLVKANLARPIRQRGGFILQETGHIRAAFSSKYLHDVYSSELRLYRDDLIGSIVRSRTGKPARAASRTRDLEEAHVAMPRDGWRDGQNEDTDDG